MIYMTSPPPRDQVEAEGHQHSTDSAFADFVLGCQDGLVNVLGIILGMAAATRDVRLILVASIAALGAESISMGAVGYTSTMARRRLYLSVADRESKELKERVAFFRSQSSISMVLRMQLTSRCCDR